MKTKSWGILLALILAACIGLSIPLLIPSEASSSAEIVSDGQVLYRVDLHLDNTFHITTSAGGSNTVTIKDGRIAVTEANCPDHYCMERGFCNSGSPIVCLPNRLVIRFSGEMEIDAIVG